MSASDQRSCNRTWTVLHEPIESVPEDCLGSPPICADEALLKGICPNRRLRVNSTLRTRLGMDDGGLSAALDRAERAIERIQRSISSRKPVADGRDEELRAKVREVVDELDELIRQAAA